ncbi:hypothetical protein LYB30171_00103 [Lysobacter luteus]|uniref:Uncharacterized protein n=1 Tax=Novilysobacter luteus TaxID=2822368 RepID=A0ABM8UBV9_9GAMM|nr:hypothetical protein LYB30171_00103 [Lysobacter luteus]
MLTPRQPWHASCVPIPAPSGAGAWRRSELEQGLTKCPQGKRRGRMSGDIRPLFYFWPALAVEAATNTTAVTRCAGLALRGRAIRGPNRSMQARVQRWAREPRIRESPAWRGFRCRRRRPTGTEQGGSVIPCRTSTLKRQPDYVALRRNLSIPADRRHPRTRASGFDFARPLDRAAARPTHHLLHPGAASLARGRRRGRTCDGGRLRTALLLHDRRGRAVDPLALEAV